MSIRFDATGDPVWVPRRRVWVRVNARRLDPRDRGWEMWQEPFWQAHPGVRHSGVTWLECSDAGYAAWLERVLVDDNGVPACLVSVQHHHPRVDIDAMEVD